MSKDRILELINRFVSGQDTSVSLANEIEVAIDDEYPDDDFMQDIVEMLASYRPGGGDFLYDEEVIRNKLLKVKDRL